MAYLRYSFAVDGDRVAINEATQPSGIISMQSGYPSPYSLIPTNPLAKKIERTKFNQLMYLVTSEIRQYQQFGTPNFITSGENGGVDYEYAKGARIVESGVLYESLIDANTDARSVITSWMPANAIGQGALGQCQLTIDSGDLLLMPKNGNKLMIGGINYPVPSAGITLSVGGASANTLYYVYAFMNGATMTLEVSGSGYVTDADTGILVKNSDASRTLVGLVQTDAVPIWSLVRSWYNDSKITSYSYFTTDRSTQNTTSTELNSEIRVKFLAWANELVVISLNGGAIISLGGGDAGYGYLGISLDGATPEDNASLALGVAVTGALASDDWLPISANLHKSGLSEGLHYATLTAKVVITSGTPTIVAKGSATSGERTTLTVSCGV